jgi:hypothetical protein
MVCINVGQMLRASGPRKVEAARRVLDLRHCQEQDTVGVHVHGFAGAAVMEESFVMHRSALLTDYKPDEAMVMNVEVVNGADDDQVI